MTIVRRLIKTLKQLPRDERTKATVLQTIESEVSRHGGNILQCYGPTDYRCSAKHPEANPKNDSQNQGKIRHDRPEASSSCGQASHHQSHGQDYAVEPQRKVTEAEDREIGY
ncbi:hypothetical protein SNEBB_010333 [Seison nebaliae]|nr:hypothetical protein SNEBB_010333 [Seison nebaliae]